MGRACLAFLRAQSRSVEVIVRLKEMLTFNIKSERSGSALMDHEVSQLEKPNLFCSQLAMYDHGRE